MRFKKTLCVTFLFFFGIETNAQFSCADYVVTRTTGITYTSIQTTGNSVPAWRNTTGAGSSGGADDDNRSYQIDIGFDFWYLGVRYTKFSVSTNGYIDFSAATDDGTGTGSYGYKNTVFSSTSGTKKTLLTLAPFYEDQTTHGNSNPLGDNIKYLVQGSAPNRTLTVEWVDMCSYAELPGPAGLSSLNYQLVLHETTGIIDFQYGTMTQGGNSWSFSCGLTGTDMTGPLASELLTQQTVNTTTFSNSSKNNLTPVPTGNTKLTFTPPTPTGNPTGLSFTSLLQTGVTLNWTDHATNEAGYVVYYSLDNATFAFSQQTAAGSGAMSTPVTGLVPGTVYYFQLYAVTDGHLSTALTGSITTNPSTIVTSTVTGTWGTASTWDCNCVPSLSSNAIVADNTIVTIGSNGVCNSLTVGQATGGTGGKLIIGNSGTGRTLSITSDLTIATNGTFTTSTTAATHSLTIGRNITNNNNLNFAGTSKCNVTFNAGYYPGNLGNQTVSGSGALTTFNNITIDMGSSQSNITEVTATNFTAAANFLTLTDGVFKLSSPSTVTPFNASVTLPSTTGFWLNNAGATVNSASGVTISLAGYIKVSSGQMTIGGGSNDCLTSTGGGSLIMTGGSLNIAGRFDRLDNTSINNFSMSSGTLTLATQGSSTASMAPFMMDVSGSNFFMSGGTIIIQRAGNTNLGYLNNITSTISGDYSVTGGTLQIGNGSTPAASTIQINSTIPVYNLTVNSSNATAQVTTNSLTVSNDLTLTLGTYNPNALTTAVGHNMVNNATFTTSGTISFNGSSAQTISGSSVTTFSNLTVANTSGDVTLAKPANVSTTLALTSGLLNTDATNILVMQSGSTAPALTAASTSYVNGPLQYQKASSGASTLNFPVGTSPDCRPFTLTVNHSAATQYNYTAQTFNADANGLGYTLAATTDTVSYKHYWSIDRTTSAGVSAPSTNLSGNQTVKFYFGTNDGVYEGTNYLTIVKNVVVAGVQGTQWFDIGGTVLNSAGGAWVNSGSAQAGSVTSTSAPSTFTSFSTFTLGSKLTGWNSLPIKLLTFTATPNGNNVDVKWTSATELNNKNYTIERSQDGQTFTELTTVPSKAPNGNSTSKLDYKITDTKPLGGTSYYRLKQTDFNGKSESFTAVSVNFAGSKSITFNVYPNPNAGQFKADFSGIENNHEVQILMHDEHGRLVYSNSFYSQESASSVDIIPQEKIGKGIYFCTLMVEGVKQTVKVIVE